MQSLTIHRGLRLLAACVAATIAQFALAQALPAAASDSVGMSAERLAKNTTEMNREIAEKSFPASPSPLRAYYRRMMKDLVSQALVD